MGNEIVFSIDPNWLAATVLLSLRLAAFLLMTPLLPTIGVPPTVRIALVVGLSLVLVGALPAAKVGSADPLALAHLLPAACTELALGATMALGVHLAMSMFALAGRILDVQIGFGISQIVDPITRQQLPILSGAFQQFAVVAFFLGNVHHTMLRGFAMSLEKFPLGQPWSLSDAFGSVVSQFAALFTLGFALAAPVVACLLFVDLGLAVIARNLPQINVFILGLPIKVLVGLAALSLWIVLAGGVVARIHGSILRSWGGWFAHG